MARIAPAVVLALAVTLLAACGSGSSGSSSTTVPTNVTPQENTVYERAYTECSSTDRQGLVAKYKISNPTNDNIARAVGAAWSDRYGAGETGTQAGAAGCRDGLASKPGSSA